MTTYSGTLTRDLIYKERKTIFPLKVPRSESPFSVFLIPRLVSHLFLLLGFSATSEKASGLCQEKSQGQKGQRNPLSKRAVASCSCLKCHDLPSPKPTGMNEIPREVGPPMTMRTTYQCPSFCRERTWSLQSTKEISAFTFSPSSIGSTMRKSPARGGVKSTVGPACGGESQAHRKRFSLPKGCLSHLS